MSMLRSDRDGNVGFIVNRFETENIGEFSTCVTPFNEYVLCCVDEYPVMVNESDAYRFANSLHFVVEHNMVPESQKVRLLCIAHRLTMAGLDSVDGVHPSPMTELVLVTFVLNNMALRNVLPFLCDCDLDLTMSMADVINMYGIYCTLEYHSPGETHLCNVFADLTREDVGLLERWVTVFNYTHSPSLVHHRRRLRNFNREHTMGGTDPGPKSVMTVKGRVSIDNTATFHRGIITGIFPLVPVTTDEGHHFTMYGRTSARRYPVLMRHTHFSSAACKNHHRMEFTILMDYIVKHMEMFSHFEFRWNDCVNVLSGSGFRDEFLWELSKIPVEERSAEVFFAFTEMGNCFNQNKYSSFRKFVTRLLVEADEGDISFLRRFFVSSLSRTSTQNFDISSLKVMFATKEWLDMLSRAPMVKFISKLVIEAFVYETLCSLPTPPIPLIICKFVSDFSDIEPKTMRKFGIILGVVDEVSLESAAGSAPTILTKLLEAAFKRTQSVINEVSAEEQLEMEFSWSEEECLQNNNKNEDKKKEKPKNRYKPNLKTFNAALPITGLLAAVLSDLAGLTDDATGFVFPLKTLVSVSSMANIVDACKAVFQLFKYRLEMFIESGKVWDLLFASPVERFVAESKRLKSMHTNEQRANTMIADPKTIFDLYDKLVEEYEKLPAKSKSDPTIRQWATINSGQRDYWETVYTSGNTRIQPFGLIYTGMPGVGKTARVRSDAQLSNIIYNMGKRAFCEADVYIFEPHEKHQNGAFQPQTVVFNDFTSDGLIKGIDIDVPKVMQRILDVAAMRVERADLDGKAEPYIVPKLMIITSNEHSFNFMAFGSDHRRLARRFNISVEMCMPKRLEGKYRDLGEAIVAEGEQLLEELIYKIYRPTVVGPVLYATPTDQMKKLDPVAHEPVVVVGEVAYTKYLGDMMQAHYRKQDTLKKLTGCNCGVSWHNHKKPCQFGDVSCNWNSDEERPTFMPQQGPVVYELSGENIDDIDFLRILIDEPQTQGNCGSMTSRPIEKLTRKITKSVISDYVTSVQKAATPWIEKLKIVAQLTSVVSGILAVTAATYLYRRKSRLPKPTVGPSSTLGLTDSIRESGWSDKRKEEALSQLREYSGQLDHDALVNQIMEEKEVQHNLGSELGLVDSSPYKLPNFTHNFEGVSRKTKNPAIRSTTFDVLERIVERHTFPVYRDKNDSPTSYQAKCVLLEGNVFLSQGHVLKHARYVLINRCYYPIGEQHRVNNSEYVLFKTNWSGGGVLRYWLDVQYQNAKMKGPLGKEIDYFGGTMPETVISGYKVEKTLVMLGVGTTKPGDCGTPYICRIDNHNAGIAGLHLWGFSENMHGFEAIVKQDLEEALKKFPPVSISIDYGQGTMQSIGRPYKLNPFLYYDNEDVVPLDLQDPSNASTGASKITINPEFKEFVGEMVVPDLTKRKKCVDGVIYHSSGHKLEGMLLTPEFNPDAGILRKACHDFFHAGDKPPIDKLSPFTPEAIIYGGPGIKKISFSTSSGSFKESRQVLLADVIDSRVMENIEDLIEALKKGMVMTYKKCNYKDEVIKAKKNSVAKYRIFMAAELGYLIVCKMFLLPVVEFVYRNREYYEAMGHFNATSPEYRQFYHLLKDFSPKRCLFGDFSAMDSCLFQMITWEIAREIEILCKQAGYTDVSAKIAGNIIRSGCLSLLSLEGFLAVVMRGMASGEFFTYWLNCIVVSILYRYCFYKFKTKEVDNFRKYVVLRTGGDDSAGSSKTDAVSMHTMQKACAEMGYRYTDSQKRKDFPLYSPIKDFEFFKRRPVEIDGLIYGALEPASILKSLAFYKGGGASRTEVLADAIDAAYREYALHGHEVYDEFDRLIQHKRSQMQLQFPIRKIPYRIVLSKHDGDELGIFSMIGSGEPEIISPVGLGAPRLESSSVYRGLVLPMGGNNQITANNSKVENSSADVNYTSAFTGAVRPSNSLPFYAAPGGMSSTEKMDLQDFLKRPVFVESGTLTTPVPDGTGLFEKWLSNPAIKEKLSHYKLVRGRPKVTVVTQGFSFQYGRIVLAFDCLTTGTFGAPSSENQIHSIVQALQAPHITMDTSVSATYTLELPWPSITGWKGLYQVRDGGCDFSMNTFSLSTTQSISGNSLVFTYNIFFSLEDAEVSIPVIPKLQSAAPVEGSISGPMSAAADIVEGVSRVPGVPQFMTPAAMALRAGANMAKAMGYCVPEDHNYSPMMLNRFNSPMSYIEGKQSIDKLSNHPNQAVPVSPSSAGIGSEDDMMIRNIASRPGYICKLNWLSDISKDSDTASDTSPSIPVTPCYYMEKPDHITETTTYYPPLAFVSLPFMYWRGSIKYRVEVVASAYHRGVLGINVNYETTGAVTGDLAHTNVTPTYYIDLSDSSRVVEFEVQWGCALNWLNTYPYGSLFTDPDSANPEVSCYNATLEFFSAIDVVSSSDAGHTAKPVDVLVYSWAGDDFALNRPSLTTINGLGLRRGTATLQSAEDQGHVEQVDVEETTENIEVAMTLPADAYSLLGFGESFTSIKQLMVKYGCEGTIRGLEVDESADRNLEVVVLPVITQTPYCTGLIDSWDYYGDSTRWLTHPMTFRTWFQCAFLGYRGSINFKLNVESHNSSTRPAFNGTTVSLGHIDLDELPFNQAMQGAADTPFIRFPQELGNGTSNFTIATFGAQWSANYFWTDTDTEALVGYHNELNNFFEYNVPYVRNVNYVPIRNTTDQIVKNHGYPIYDREQWVFLRVPSEAGTAKNLSWYSAAGDDFTLYQFMYVPPMSQFVYASYDTEKIINPSRPPAYPWKIGV